VERIAFFQGAAKAANGAVEVDQIQYLIQRSLRKKKTNLDYTLVKPKTHTFYQILKPLQRGAYTATK
jgi:hypothetical protein